MIKEKLLEELKGYRSFDDLEERYRHEFIDFVTRNTELLGRENKKGHITASAWIVNEEHTKALFTHHRKLDAWFQLGGHTDLDEYPLDAALREAMEESGLNSIHIKAQSLFDLDVHAIPERNDEPEHNHYDIRYFFVADDEEPLMVSSESKDLKWIPLQDIPQFNDSTSIMRMVEKTQK